MKERSEDHNEEMPEWNSSLNGGTKGEVMCCQCFGLFHKHDLHRLENGQYEDVCLQCYEEEEILLSTENAYFPLKSRG